MICTSNHGRVIEIWLPNAEITGVPLNKNYYKQNSSTGEIILAADNDDECSFAPLMQSSLIFNMDTVVCYEYIIDSNPSALKGQTGHWKLLG